MAPVQAVNRLWLWSVSARRLGRTSDEPNVFALWEVYRDEDAVQAHRATEHFQRLVLDGIRPMAQQRNATTLVPV